MTQLTGACDRDSLARLATPQSPARKGSLAVVLADPRVRLGAGTAVMLATAIAARRHRVSRGEATAFRVVNGLPDALYPSAWIVMQLGTLGAAPAAAAVAWLTGTASWRAGSSPAAPAPGRPPSWSSGWYAAPGQRPCSQAPTAAARRDRPGIPVRARRRRRRPGRRRPSPPRPGRPRPHPGRRSHGGLDPRLRRRPSAARHRRRRGTGTGHRRGAGPCPGITVADDTPGRLSSGGGRLLPLDGAQGRVREGMTIRPLSWALRPCQCAAAGHMMRQ